MGRNPCCSKQGLNRGAWTAEEDRVLIDFVKANGEGRWRNLPKKAGLKRCGKSCRLRWLNYLRPDIKRGNISPDEEELIVRLHKLLGNRWSLIAGRLPERTDNEIKNYWNTSLGKRVNLNHQNNTSTSCSPTQNVKSCSNQPQGIDHGHDMDATTLEPTKTAANSHDSAYLNNLDNFPADFTMDFNAGELSCLSHLLNYDQPLFLFDELI